MKVNKKSPAALGGRPGGWDRDKQQSVLFASMNIIAENLVIFKAITAHGYNLDIRDRVASSRFEVGSQRSLIPSGGYK